MELTNLLNQVVFWLIPGIISRKVYLKLVSKRASKDWEDFLEILLFSMVNYLVYGLYFSTVVKYSASAGFFELLSMANTAAFVQRLVWAVLNVFLQPLGLVSLLAYLLFRWWLKSREWADGRKKVAGIVGRVLFAGWVGVLMVKIYISIEEIAYFYRGIKFFQQPTGIDWGEIVCASLIAVVTPYLVAYIDTHKLLNRIGRFLGVTRHFGDEDVWDFVHNGSNDDWVYVRDHKLGLIYACWISAYSDSGGKRELLLEDVVVYDKSGKRLDSADRMYICRDDFELTIDFVKPTESENAAREEGV